MWSERLVELTRTDHADGAFRTYSAPEENADVVDAIMPARWVVSHV